MITNFDTKLFRQVMGTFATGVTVVTTNGETGPHGMTANAFMSVSLDPPLILVSVDHKARTNNLIKQAKVFGVNFLRVDQENLSNHFAGKPNIENEQELFTWYEEIPLLADCLATVACRLWNSFEAGDHTLFVGEVLDLKMYEGEPLLFYKGKYREIKPQ